MLPRATYGKGPAILGWFCGPIPAGRRRGGMDAAQLGGRPGEGPAIVKVHHFGFVLPNLVPWILFPLGDDVGDGRGPRYGGAQQSPARATRTTLARAPPLKTFIILGSFCQSSFDPWHRSAADRDPIPSPGWALLGHLLYTRQRYSWGCDPIEKVHYFGFVLPNPLCGPRTSVVVHELRAATPRRATRRARATKSDLFQGLSMETFIILASFCQIYYPRGVMDAPARPMARGGHSLFWLRSARCGVRSYPRRPTTRGWTRPARDLNDLWRGPRRPAVESVILAPFCQIATSPRCAVMGMRPAFVEVHDRRSPFPARPAAIFGESRPLISFFLASFCQI